MVISNTLRNISVVSVAAPKFDIYCLQNGEENIHVYDAVYIRLLLQIFRVPYKIFLPPDGEGGAKLPDENWTGKIGMVHRSEVDLAVATTMNYDRFQEVNFSYPYLFTDATFMTDKPKQNPTSLAIIHPFPSLFWFFLIATILLFSFVLFLHVHRKQTYQNVLFMAFGSLLEKSINMHLRKCNLKLIISVWLMFVFVIINSYKAVLLSILTLPRLTGIKNIPDLAKAAEHNSITCYSYKNSPLQQILLTSEFPTWRIIGKCMQRNVVNSENVEEAFVKAPANKAFITERSFIKQYEDEYFISEDSFYPSMFAFSVSKTFRKLRYLDEKIHRLFEAGLFQKIEKDEKYILKSKTTFSDSIEPPTLKILELEDLKGAFIVLFFGYALSITVFFIEITVNRYFPKSGKKRKNLKNT